MFPLLILMFSSSLFNVCSSRSRLKQVLLAWSPETISLTLEIISSVQLYRENRQRRPSRRRGSVFPECSQPSAKPCPTPSHACLHHLSTSITSQAALEIRPVSPVIIMYPECIYKVHITSYNTRHKPL